MEDCDGNDLGDNASCEDVGLGASDEALSCNADCSYNYGNCSGCGDGVVTAPESCEPANPQNDDKSDLNGGSCEDLGFDGGSLNCSDGCAYDTSFCYSCGDAIINGFEECDGADFGSQQCSDFTSNAGTPFTSGSLSCGNDCTIDTSNCMNCGDAAVTGTEICDGSELNGNTCTSLGMGFTAGTLGCNNSCSGFDTSNCTTCGNGNAESSTEQCDGNDLNGESCSSQGFSGGSLSCSSQCTFDTGS